VAGRGVSTGGVDLLPGEGWSLGADGRCPPPSGVERPGRGRPAARSAAPNRPARGTRRNDPRELASARTASGHEHQGDEANVHFTAEREGFAPGPHRATITEMRSSDPDPELPTRHAAGSSLHQRGGPAPLKVKDLAGCQVRGGLHSPYLPGTMMEVVSPEPVKGASRLLRKWPTAPLERNPPTCGRAAVGLSYSFDRRRASHGPEGIDSGEASEVAWVNRAL
jgi:hypothetical protein